MRQQANTGQFQQQFHGRSRVAQPVETKPQEWKRFLTRDEQKRYEELGETGGDLSWKETLACLAGAFVVGVGISVSAALVTSIAVPAGALTTPLALGAMAVNRLHNKSESDNERAELRTEASVRASLHRPTR